MQLVVVTWFLIAAQLLLAYINGIRSPMMKACYIGSLPGLVLKNRGESSDEPAILTRTRTVLLHP